MSSETKQVPSQAELEAVRVEVVEAGTHLAKLKADKANAADIEAATKKIQALKDKLAAMVEAATAEASAEKKRAESRQRNFETLVKRKFFVVPSFEIHGGVAGLYDFGPPGAALMHNMLKYWRQHFILKENMLEVFCTCLTPEEVLVTSGHVAKFNDFMVKDVKTGEAYRADKLLVAWIEKLLEDPMIPPEKRNELLNARAQADSYDGKQLWDAIQKFEVKALNTGNDVSEPYPFNLMFSTSIGPTGTKKGYLRPETAQGIFVNFRRLLEFNGGKMPFAAAQIGSAYRNEIAPRNGLIRVREFTMAEIEHFVNPDDKSHPKFGSVSNMKVPLYWRDIQDGKHEAVVMGIGEAVHKGIISSETMGYFLGRTYMYLTKIGIKPEKLRFRQHLATEMAHYAKDCWDAEIMIFGSWTECVGHADRSAYDLKVHTEKTGVDLTAREDFEEKKLVQRHKITLNKMSLGKRYKKQANLLSDYLLKDISKDQAIAIQDDLKKGPKTITLCTGESFELQPDDYKLELFDEYVSGVSYIPNVIEPSFGIGRILYALLEHSFDDQAYEDEAKAVLRLPAIVAPYQVAILSQTNKDVLWPFMETLDDEMTHLHLSTKIDHSGGSIGKKYARADELGVPFDITVDMQTPEDNCVTVRDRDSTQQIRIKVAEAPMALHELVHGKLTWAHAYEKYPKFFRPGDDE